MALSASGGRECTGNLDERFRSTELQLRICRPRRQRRIPHHRASTERHRHAARETGTWQVGGLNPSIVKALTAIGFAVRRSDTSPSFVTTKWTHSSEISGTTSRSSALRTTIFPTGARSGAPQRQPNLVSEPHCRGVSPYGALQHRSRAYLAPPCWCPPPHSSSSPTNAGHLKHRCSSTARPLSDSVPVAEHSLGIPNGLVSRSPVACRNHCALGSAERLTGRPSWQRQSLRSWAATPQAKPS